MAPAERTPRPYRTAAAVVTFLTLYQGVVPLVARGVFGRGQRLAPAMWLPAPWWWVACLAVTAAGLGLLAAIDTARTRHAAPDPDPDATAGATDAAGAAEATGEPATRAAGDRDRDGYDALAALVFLVGLYNGVAPFVARLVFDGNLLLALPLRLPSPWWWVTSLAVLVATAALLVVIGQAEERGA